MNTSDPESPFDLVAASYQRARRSGELFDTFYKLFLRKSPEIPPMFAHTDFPHQKLMLRESLLEMLEFARTGSGRDEIERLARRHREFKVQPRHTSCGSTPCANRSSGTIRRLHLNWRSCGATPCGTGSMSWSPVAADGAQRDSSGVISAACTR